jgi:hypothetical protein
VESRDTSSIIQEVFPAYHGVAWYWREFTAPENPLPGGRTLLRFAAVDYLAEVWVNGISVGGHEGGETPFVLDVTGAIRTDARNLLAVRVLNPTNERIDGIVLAETPHRNKAVPYFNGRSFNTGGITETVELLLVLAVRVEDVYARPDPKTGRVVLSADVVNCGDGPDNVNIEFTLCDEIGLMVYEESYAAEPSMTDRYVWFFNQVLKEVHKKYPKKKIGFYAYHTYKLPPRRWTPDPVVFWAEATSDGK